MQRWPIRRLQPWSQPRYPPNPVIWFNPQTRICPLGILLCTLLALLLTIHFYKTSVGAVIHSSHNRPSSSSSIPSRAATDLYVSNNDLTNNISTSSTPTTINLYALLTLDVNQKLTCARVLWLLTPKNASSSFSVLFQLRSHAAGSSSWNHAVLLHWRYNTTGS